MRPELYAVERGKMADFVDENGKRIMCIGPICTVVPSRYHQYLSRDTLKSYLACDQKYGDHLQKQMCPADVPVIVRTYTNTVYPKVLNSLNDLGRAAEEDLHPWLLCTMIDWAEFDTYICGTPKQQGTICEDKSTLSGTSSMSSEISQTANDQQKLNDTKMQMENERADLESSSPVDIIGKVQTKWPREKVLQLIDLHVKYEEMFIKPSTKKKHVWGLIAAELTCDTFNISGDKAEQKWKNMTKTFRDTTDHNRKSGNEP